MIIHLTDKLSKKLKTGPLSKIELETKPHLRWYGNFFRAERVQYVLVTNAKSLFSVVLYGRGLTDFNSFYNEFLRTLRGYLTESGMRMIYERIIATESGDITLSKTADRSVLGSMNDMVNANKYMIETHGRELSPWDMAELINHTPYSAAGRGFPIEVFARMSIDE